MEASWDNEAKESKAHEQSVGRRAGDMAERHTEGISLRRWQLFKGAKVGTHSCCAAARELLLGFVPDGAQHLKSCSRIHAVVQQSGLANSGLPADTIAPPRPAARRQNPVEYLALASSPE